MKKRALRRPQFKHIWVDWLTVNIYWVVCSSKQYSDLIRKTFRVEIETSDLYSGRCQRFECGAAKRVIVIWVDRKNVPNLVHEITHAIFYMFEDKGITPEGDVGEAFAYMLGHLTRTIMAKW